MLRSLLIGLCASVLFLTAGCGSTKQVDPTDGSQANNTPRSASAFTGTINTVVDPDPGPPKQYTADFNASITSTLGSNVAASYVEYWFLPVNGSWQLKATSWSPTSFSGFIDLPANYQNYAQFKIKLYGYRDTAPYGPYLLDEVTPYNIYVDTF